MGYYLTRRTKIIVSVLVVEAVAISAGNRSSQSPPASAHDPEPPSFRRLALFSLRIRAVGSVLAQRNKI